MSASPRCALAALLLALPVRAQEPERAHARATRTSSAPRIDGRLDDAVWQQATPIGELVQIEPVEGAAPSETSDIRFLYDDQYLYLGVRCFDSEPERILTTTRDRDALLDVDDRVELVIDTFHDRRNAFFFQINAGGSKGDALVTGNGANFNKPWDGIWDGVATIDSRGWSAEFALPFKTLNFAPDTSTWGFNITRFIGRKREEARWSCASRAFSLFDIFHAGDLAGLEGMQQGIGLDVVPFFVSRWQNDRPSDDKTLLGQPGFDAFYKIIPSLTLSLTVNTDFAETEVDQRQINLTRFPLFFPERRDFFLQDAGLFEFGTNFVGGGRGRDVALLPFFSRRIGLDDQGQEVPILAGAKLTGRAGDYGIGVLDVQTDDADELDGQNLFAGRVSRNLGEQSVVGALVTRGDPLGEHDNSVYGFDAGYRTNHFQGDQNLIASAYYLVSDTEDVSGDQQAFGADLRSPNDFLSWNLGALEIQENFEADLGFVPRKDIRRYDGGVDVGPRPDWDGVRQLHMGVDADVFTDTGGELETWNVVAEPLGVEWESGEFVSVNARRTHDELTEDFEISDGIIVPVGEYEFSRAGVAFETGGQRVLSAGIELEGGEFFDGHRTDYAGRLTWHPGALFNGEVVYALNQVSLPDGDFDTQLALLRANLSFTAELSWNNFVQWDTESDTIGLNSRLRWIPVPEQEVFLVFNQTMESDSSSFAPLFQELAFKITYALRF